MKPRTRINSILAVMLLCGFFPVTAGIVFAADSDNTQSSVNGASTVIKDVIHVTNTYTAAGVQLGSTQVETKDTNNTATVTTTTNGKTTVTKTSSTTSSTTTTFSAFMGGSLKTIYSNGFSSTNGDDGSASTTTSKVKKIFCSTSSTL